MGVNLRSVVTVFVSVTVAVGVITIPGRASDGSKALRSRVKDLERALEITQSDLAAAILEVNSLHTTLEDTQAELGGAIADVAFLKEKLDYVSLVNGTLEGLAGPHLIFEGCNVHIRSGSGSSVDGAYDLDSEQINSAVDPLGLGNLIIGYNEQLLPDGVPRGGSHNIVIGPRHSYPTVCGAVFGQENRLTGPLSLIAGRNNESQGYASTVSGGYANLASARQASVSGGYGNTASGYQASVSGGGANTASGFYSSVSGGYVNTASGQDSSVGGGSIVTAAGTHTWKAACLDGCP